MPWKAVGGGSDSTPGKIQQAYNVKQQIDGFIEMGKQARNWWMERHTYRLTLTEDEPLYSDVMEWFLSILPNEDQRVLRVTSTLGNRYGGSYEVSISTPDDYSNTEGPKHRLILTYDGDRSHETLLEGQRVRVWTGERSRGTGKSEHTYNVPEVTLHALNEAGRAAIERMLTRMLESRRSTKRSAMLYNMTGWGSWRRRQEVPLRSLESVVLASGQKERIIDDCQGFLDAEANYARLDIPWHRGYLFHGPPGTGKTSMAKAMAQHFGLDVFYAPLGDMQSDDDLSSLLADVHPRSILLLEDIDVFAAAKARALGEGEGGDKKISLSGLLNSLDGIMTPHGLITIMTTNDKSSLDDALTRAGRVDLDEHFEYPTHEGGARLFEWFYGEPIGWEITSKQDWQSSADLTEIFKRYMDDPDGAREALGIKTRKSA